MDSWYFEDNLSYAEIVKRASNQFGVQASEQTLTSYFRRRREELDWVEEPGVTFKERAATLDRPGLGMKLEELEARILLFSAMAAYEMSLADPSKMRAKEVRALMKMLQDNRRLALDANMQRARVDLQQVATYGKLANDFKGMQTKEEFEEMMMETSRILSAARSRAAEQKTADNGAGQAAAKLAPEDGKLAAEPDANDGKDQGYQNEPSSLFKRNQG